MIANNILVVLAGADITALLVAACGGSAATATPVPTATRPTPTTTPVAQATATLAPAPMATVGPTVTGAPVPTATEGPTLTATPVPQSTAAPTPPGPTPTPSGLQPKYGGILNLHWYDDYRNWDTWHPVGGFGTGFTKSLLGNLVQLRPGTFRIVDGLAERWEVGENGKALTFHLRRDAQWHDGNPVTSRDIVYTFNRGSDPGFTFNKALAAPIAAMQTPDDFTYKSTLRDVSASFLPGVASAFMLMCPAHVPDIAQWQKAPFGSGPSMLKADKASITYEFVKDPEYYRKDVTGRPRPYLDGITFHVIVDPQLALSAFRAGRSDCGCIFSQNWWNSTMDALLREIPNLGEAAAVGGVRSLQDDLKRAPSNNADFRQATPPILLEKLRGPGLSGSAAITD